MYVPRKAVFAALAMFIVVLSTTTPIVLLSYAQPLPVAIFTYTPSAALVGQTVSFDASASYSTGGSILLYTWNFGDGSSPVSLPGATTNYNYSAVGNYTVTLVVTDNLAQKGNTTRTVPITLNPTISFTFTPALPLVNTAVNFNASASKPASGSLVSYYWDFGDGNTLNVSTSTTTHTYVATGNYTVTLTGTDNYGFTNSSTDPITIIKAPSAGFTFTPSWPIVGDTVTFNASSSIPDGGTIVSYSWNFGDGNTGTGAVTTHIYTSYGTFISTLNITDSYGLSNTTSSQVNVRQYPTASFTYTPTLPFAGQTVTFNASASTPNGGTIVSYSWNFGDGNTGTGAVVTHSYATYGTYQVKLVVTDSEQLNNTLINPIRTIVKPYASFTHVPTDPVINTPVLFNASQSYDPDGSIVSYNWSLGDGSNVVQSGPLLNHTYTAANVYIVTLTVTEDDGLTANATMAVPLYTSVPTHDVAVAAVNISNSWIDVGGTISINVTIQNRGTAYETFNVSVYYGSNNLLPNQTVTNFAPNSTQMLQWSWNTTTVPFGYYNITATRSPLVDEANATDNTLQGGQVTVTKVGDVTGPNGVPDLKIDMRDIAFVARAFGSDPIHEPKYWNPICDLNGDGKVDMRDVASVARAFGWTAH